MVLVAWLKAHAPCPPGRHRIAGPLPARPLVAAVGTLRFAHPCISAKHYIGTVPRGMARSGWPPEAGRRSIGSLPTEAARLLCSEIAIGTSSRPGWLLEPRVRITRKGRRRWVSIA